MAYHQKIEHILQSGYSFRFGSYLTQGWELFLRGFWGFAGFTFLSFAIQMGMGLLPIIGFFGSLLITIPLNMGYYIVAHLLYRRQGTEFQHFFKGFDYVGPLVLQALVQFAALILFLAPMVFPAMDYLLEGNFVEGILNEELDFEPPSWAFILWIPLIYLLVSWRWAPLFIIFYSMNFWEALETSRRMLTRQWGLFFLFYLVAGLIAVSGIIFFAVGLLFTLAYVYCADYMAFADVTRLAEETPEDITEHLVE